MGEESFGDPRASSGQLMSFRPLDPSSHFKYLSVVFSGRRMEGALHCHMSVSVKE